MPRAALALAILLVLAACGSSRAPAPPTGYEPAEPVSCVPYARARSGLALQGDAWQWWEQAAGRYRRDRSPRPGSVLVVARTSRLPQGHVSVVRRIVSAREIRVDHANWASGAARGRIARDQPVVDVSRANDWSLVRIWHPQTGALGITSFPARGFIHPEQALASR
jgi:surface antigen